MKKSIIIIISVVVIAIIVLGIYFVTGKSDDNSNNTKQNDILQNSVNDKGQTDLEDTKITLINSEADLKDLVGKVYTNAGIDTSGLETQEVDLSDESLVKSYSGLDNSNEIEYMVVSEPLINARAYSLVACKVKDGKNANEIAEQMSENVDMRKWICVSAEKLYATSSGNIVFLIMTEEEMAKNVYDSFKTIAGEIGQEYEKTAQEEELPPDTIQPGVLEVPVDE